MEWKADILARLAEGAGENPVTWSDSDKSPEFTHVILTGGILVANPALLVYGRTYDGAAGAHMIALYYPAAGKPVIVDRGFIPLPIDPAHLDFHANATVHGIVRIPSDKAWFEMENRPEKNEWYWMDMPAMAKALGAKTVAPVYVEAFKPTGPNGPIPTGDRLANNLPNNHLQYAITWFTLACTLLIMYSIWLLRALNEEARTLKQTVDRAYGRNKNHMPRRHKIPR